METLTLINGNGQRYNKELPNLYIMGECNDAGLSHILENTGLVFTPYWNGYQAKPETSQQITKLLLTYNFKTQYNDNATIHNTILLKWCNDAGFKVDAICYNCCKKNCINTNGLNPDAMLGC